MAGGGRMNKKKKGRTWDLIPGLGRQKLGVLTTAPNIRMSFLMPHALCWAWARVGWARVGWARVGRAGLGWDGLVWAGVGLSNQLKSII